MQNLPSESKTPISASNRKSVFLREWWLIKVERESKLGVGGFADIETLGSRGMRFLGSASVGKRYHNHDGIEVYGSAAIAKRLDNNTLEAIDGILITISGCINKSRTLSYGFSSEICDQFLSGFPHTWEEYAAKSSHEKCSNTTERSFPLSFDDLPVTRVRDLLMSTTRESESCALTNIIFKDILKHTERSLNQTVSSIDSDVKVSKNSTETELDHKQDGVSLSNPTQKIIEEEDHKSHSFPVDLLHEKDSENSKATHKIMKQTQAKECNRTKMSGNIRKLTRSQKRYPLRSAQRKKNNST